MEMGSLREGEDERIAFLRTHAWEDEVSWGWGLLQKQNERTASGSVLASLLHLLRRGRGPALPSASPELGPMSRQSCRWFSPRLCPSAQHSVPRHASVIAAPRPALGAHAESVRPLGHKQLLLGQVSLQRESGSAGKLTCVRLTHSLRRGKDQAAVPTNQFPSPSWACVGSFP